MSAIYEFRYEYYDGASDKPKKYVILESSPDGNSMLIYNDGQKYCANITDKVDEFCNRIYKSSFSSWHNKKYVSDIDFFPNMNWLLRIRTDSVLLYCEGENEFPNNWNDFVQILNDIGVYI